jgi:hypothetical protein
MMLKGLTTQYLFRRTTPIARATRSCSTPPPAVSA